MIGIEISTLGVSPDMSLRSSVAAFSVFVDFSMLPLYDKNLYKSFTIFPFPLQACQVELSLLKGGGGMV